MAGNGSGGYFLANKWTALVEGRADGRTLLAAYWVSGALAGAGITLLSMALVLLFWN